jgi:hypothetical protein
VRAVRQEMNHLKASVREREVWENRRPANRPEQRAPPTEQGARMMDQERKVQREIVL